MKIPSAQEIAKSYAIWLALALPALGQIGLLLYTTFSRISYPYDLEWMEGGLLDHALRITEAQGIYVEPSVDFIPYLYTPLYTGILAVTGQMFGLSYSLGRTLSVLAMLAVMAMMVLSITKGSRSDEKPAAYAGAAAALALFSATYPWVEGWYDIVRADTLFLALVIGGLLAARALSRSGSGPNGHLQTAGAGAILALAYLTKQTGILFVAAGGLVVLVRNWRRVPAYIAGAGFLGLGSTWLLNKVSGGWFWTYVYEVPRSHDFNMDRVVTSVKEILGHFPAMTVCICLAVLAVAVTTIRKRRLPESCSPLLMWAPLFAFAIAVGAIGYGKHLAHFNHFIPAMTFGAIAAGAAIPAVVSCTRMWLPDELRTRYPIDPTIGGGLLIGALLAWQLVAAWWSPNDFIPTEADRQAGDQLIQRIAAVEGEVYVPYHPWYAHLAGKRAFTHRMGLLDLSVGKKKWRVRGFREAFAQHAFSAVVMDNRPPGAELSGLRSGYRVDELFDDKLAPQVYTGAGMAKGGYRLVPKELWVPAVDLPAPEGVTVIENFERGSLGTFRAKGRAWGRRALSRSLPKQGTVSRYFGRYFVSSFHGGDGATGTLQSGPFSITGNRITFRLSGGNSPKLRAELVIEGEVVRTATGHNSEAMQEIVWSVAPYLGKRAIIRLVDESTDSWGHLNADQFWLFKDDSSEAELPLPPRSPVEDTR